MCAHSTCCCGQEPEPEAEAEPEPEPEGDGEKKDETLTKIEKDRKKADEVRACRAPCPVCRVPCAFSAFILSLLRHCSCAAVAVS